MVSRPSSSEGDCRLKKLVIQVHQISVSGAAPPTSRVLGAENAPACSTRRGLSEGTTRVVQLADKMRITNAWRRGGGKGPRGKDLRKVL